MTTHDRQEYAARLKREMNCCQAVVRAFADTLDMPVDKLMQLFAGFGSGMGTMEVPCCGGLEMAAKKALQASGKFIPWQVVTISLDGRILDA